MNSKKPQNLALGMAIILFFVGIISYTAFSAKAPVEPVRMLYRTLGGDVLFNHKTHVSEAKKGTDCFDCHHHPADDELNTQKCDHCHSPSPEIDRTKACLECHDYGDYDASEVIKRSDSYHKQCAGCHEERNVEPKEKSCDKCHMMLK